MRFRRRPELDQLELNLIPLIDVLLVVLIFLAASSTFTQHAQIPVHLPQAQSAQTQSTELLIAIDQNGNYAIGPAWLSGAEHEQLMAAIQQQLSQTEKTALLVLADEQAPHGAVIRLMDAARLAGVTELNFATSMQP